MHQIDATPAFRTLGTAAAGALAVLIASVAAGQPADLFINAAAADAVADRADGLAADPADGPALDSFILQQRLVHINYAAAAQVRAAEASESAPTIRLNMFRDADFMVRFDRVEPTFSGGYSLSGNLVGEDGGSMILVVNGEHVAGTVRAPGGLYRIRPGPDGQHILSQINPLKLPPEGVLPRMPDSLIAQGRRAMSWRSGQVVSDGCDGCPELVVIPAGTFMMGSPASEAGREDDEGPRHEVTLSSFAIGVTEVTFDEWEACVRGGGCNYRPDDRGWGQGARPVINVSWADVQAYVRWLSESTGAAYRLPSESEWEYAARAGTTTPFHTGATISTDQANYDGDYVYGSGRRGSNRRRTTPAGTFAPNAFGLYDVHGNVWEWVEDCWHDDYRGAPSDGTAWTAGGNCGRRVLRGGSWYNSPRVVRSALRHKCTTGLQCNLAGFRVSRTLD